MRSYTTRQNNRAKRFQGLQGRCLLGLPCQDCVCPTHAYLALFFRRILLTEAFWQTRQQMGRFTDNIQKGNVWEDILTIFPTLSGQSDSRYTDNIFLSSAASSVSSSGTLGRYNDNKNQEKGGIAHGDYKR